MKRWLFKKSFQIESFILQRVVGYHDDNNRPHGILYKLRRMLGSDSVKSEEVAEPAEVSFSECKNPDCPVGCPDSHCLDFENVDDSFKWHGLCPDCHGKEFYEGPSGGASINVVCANKSCGSRFNVMMMGNLAERISKPSPNKKLVQTQSTREDS